MNKFQMIFGCLASFLFLCGCSTFYQPIPKDTVMIKEIAQITENPELENQGTLSEETIESLSIHAINTYYKANFSAEDLSLEVNLTELDQIKTMLYSFWGKSDVDPLVRFKKELDEIGNGLYSVTATNRYDTSNQYTIMLNASDGEVLEMEYYQRYGASDNNAPDIEHAEVISITKQLLGSLGGITLTELDFQEPEPTIIKDLSVVRVILRNKTTGTMQVALSFDRNRKELLGFSKGIMFGLSYSYFR